MKVKIGKIILFFTLLIFNIFFMTGSSHAFMTVDGKLDEWGVTPGPWGSSIWTPNQGITYTVDDYQPGTNGGYVSPGWGGQAFDVEAMYMKNDGDNLYFAVVTGFPKNGVPGYSYIPGDIGLDFNGDGLYEYGICVADRNGTFQKGDLYKTSSASSWANGLWTLQDPLSNPTYLQSYSSKQDFGGVNLTYNDDYYSADGHWVIEGYVPTSAFGSDWAHGKEIGVHWAMSCSNDYLNLDYTATPEPATMSLLGLGIIGLAGFRKKKKA